MRIVIIGGGIAGLFSGILMRNRFPDADIVILEKSLRVGGRVFTKKYPDGSSFEAGAGRFEMKHHTLMALFKRYGLDKDIIPIGNTIVEKSGPLLSTNTNDIDFRKMTPEDILIMVKNDTRVTSKMLWENTIETLVEKLYGKDAMRKIVHGFEYDSEIQTARAQTALRAITDTFRGEFGVMGGGLSKLIRCMENEITKKGGTILLGTKCTGVEKIDNGTFNIQWINDTGETIENADKVIFCTPRKITCDIIHTLIGKDKTDQLYGEEVIKDEPLLRVYARFPKPWIDHKVVTRKGVRYIIPVSSEPPIVMISYTDGPIARVWSQFRDEVGDRECANEIINQLRTLFPRKTIPDPIWVSFEEWKVGASFWKPSNHDITNEKARKLRENPMANVFVCGEFLSIYHQAWMEGALKTCVRVAKRIKG